MPRPHIESIHSYAVEPVEVRDGALAGTRQRPLSSDAGDGSSSSLVSFPVGWSGRLGDERPVELLVVSGAGVLAGRQFAAGTWAWIPAGANAELSFFQPADAVVMVEAVRPPAGGVEIIDIVEAPWEEIEVVEGVPPGLVLKTLRVDPELGDRSWIAGSVQRWLAGRGEIHPTVEEAFLIRGDCRLANSGLMLAGDYFWRPGGIHHGPFATREGFTFFFRTKGGDMEVTWDDPPEWPAVARRYCDEVPWFTPGR